MFAAELGDKRHRGAPDISLSRSKTLYLTATAGERV